MKEHCLYSTWFRWFPSSNFSVRHSGHRFSSPIPNLWEFLYWVCTWLRTCDRTASQIWLIFNTQRHFYFNETDMKWKNSLYSTWFRWFPSSNFSVRHSGHDFLALPPILWCFCIEFVLGFVWPHRSSDMLNFHTLKDTFILMKLIWNERTVLILHDSGGFHRVIFLWGIADTIF